MHEGLAKIPSCYLILILLLWYLLPFSVPAITLLILFLNLTNCLLLCSKSLLSRTIKTSFQASVWFAETETVFIKASLMYVQMPARLFRHTVRLVHVFLFKQHTPFLNIL